MLRRKQICRARRWTIVTAVAAALAGTLTAQSSASAQQTCVKMPDADVPAMFDIFNAALATQHPDKVTRLFSVEALLIGHHAEKPRTGYMDIRDYYVYFLTGRPHAHVMQRQMHTGCGFVIDEGVVEWKFDAAGRPPVQAHYFMRHEYGPGGWRIAHYHDVQIETPKPLAMARKVAVAGFLKRAPMVTRSTAKSLQPAASNTSADYKPGAFRDDVPVFD